MSTNLESFVKAIKKEISKNKKTKIMVLDTSVLIHEPESIYNFDDNTLVLPLTVVEELDKLKTTKQEARWLSSEISTVLASSTGSLFNGVQIKNKRVFIVPDFDFKDKLGKEEFNLDLSINDNKIILTAFFLNKNFKNTVLVSKDNNMRVKGSALGLDTQDYKNSLIVQSYSDIYTGFQEGGEKEEENMFKLIKKSRSQHLEIYKDGKWKKSPIQFKTQKGVKRDFVMNISPMDHYQAAALNLLTDKNISACTLIGGAGCGKTLMTVVSAIDGILKGDYKKIIISRATIPLGGRDIGYLPGTKEEKMEPWVQPFYDSIDLIEEKAFAQNAKNPIFISTMIDESIEIESLAYVRGRSINNAFIIIDEAQNLTPHEVKTIVTRAGFNTKIVLLGDIHQIDNHHLSFKDNGLVYTTERLRGFNEFGTVFLKNVFRSNLADYATRVM